MEKKEAQLITAREVMHSNGTFKVRGILSNLSEGVTKTGKPYVFGLLSDKDISLNYKAFDYSLTDFEKKYEIKRDEAVPVEVLGEYDENYGLKGKKLSLLENEEINNYVNISDFPIIDNIMLYGKTADKLPKDSVMFKLIDTIIECYQGLLEYMPYDSVIHNEKGGCIQFIANLIRRCISENGMSKRIVEVVEEKESVTYEPIVDKNVVLCAIMCHRIGYLAYAKADYITGKLIDNGDFGFSIFGSAEQTSLMMVYNLIREISTGKPTPNDALNVIHCLSCLAGNTPATLEAEFFVNIVNAEKTEYLANKAIKELASGNVIKTNGRNYIKL